MFRGLRGSHGKRPLPAERRAIQLGLIQTGFSAAFSTSLQGLRPPSRGVRNPGNPDASRWVRASSLGELRPGEGAALRAIQAQLRHAAAGALTAQEALTAIEHLVRHTGSSSLSPMLEQAARLLSTLARELDRPLPALSVDEPGLELSADWARTLLDCFIHVFQNAMVHGIEGAEERLARHKPAQGQLSVRARRTAGDATITIADDGRGLPLAALRQQAGESEQQAAARIFEPGASTAPQPSASSGRGVGLDAVRTRLRELGGDVTVALGAETAPGFRSFALVLVLPAEALLPGPS